MNKIMIFFITTPLFSIPLTIHDVDGFVREVNITSDDTTYVNYFNDSLLIDRAVNSLHKVEGIDRIVGLKKIILSHMDLSEADFSFLEDIPQLDTIELVFVTIADLQWIQYAPQVRAIGLTETVRVINTSSPINFSSNENIEYFEMNGVHLSNIPIFINIPNTMRAINLGWSYFESVSIESLAHLSGNHTVFHFSDDVRDELEAQGAATRFLTTEQVLDVRRDYQF